MASETRPAIRVRVSRSRPMLSVPKKKYCCLTVALMVKLQAVGGLFLDSCHPWNTLERSR